MIKLSDKRLDRLSEFFSNASLIFIASTISPLFTGNPIRAMIGFSGILISICFLIISLIIIK